MGGSGSEGLGARASKSNPAAGRPVAASDVAVLRHELIELFLVLGVTQPIEEVAEFGLLFLKAPQRFHAVFVEGAVAARGRTEAAKAAALHVIAHPLHLVLHPLHLVLTSDPDDSSNPFSCSRV